MPVKDLRGSPRFSHGERAMIAAIFTRLGLPMPKPRGLDRGDPEPVPAPSGPAPTLLSGGAAASLD